MQKPFFLRTSTILLSCGLVILTACGGKTDTQTANTGDTGNTIAPIDTPPPITPPEPLTTPATEASWVSPSQNWDTSYPTQPRAVQIFTGESGIGGFSQFPINACSHQYMQPPPFPIIDNNTGKPLDPQPHLTAYLCVPPEIMRVCSHQPGEPTQGIIVDSLTGYRLDPQPYLKYYSCGQPELLWRLGEFKNYRYWDLDVLNATD